MIHGFGASPAWFNAMFFSLREFFRNGWEVVMFTLPFHGGRRGARAPFNGAELFSSGFAHFCEAMRLLTVLKQVPRELIEQALALHSPLSYEPVVPKSRLMVVGGLGDRLAPPEQSLLLWEHWGRPRLSWFPGSHVLHFERRDYLDAMRELMASSG